MGKYTKKAVHVWLFLLACLCPALVLAQAQFSYDILYIRAPRPGGDTAPSRIAEVFAPLAAEPGTDLMLLHPDGSEEVLVPGGIDGAIIDPVVSLDAQWVYYVRFPSVRDVNPQRNNAPRQGADIWKIHLTTRAQVQLTQQIWTPTPTIAPWAVDPKNPKSGEAYLGYGIFNTGPCPLPGGKLAFTSSRNGLSPVEGYTFPNMQLFVLDETTGIVEQIGYLNLGSALHPTVLTDGRIMFSSYESQGLRDRRLWGLWAMYPDGRSWEPLFSAFLNPLALHWQTQMGGNSGAIVVIPYYNLNNWGMGTAVKIANFPLNQPMAPGILRFGDPDPAHASNPKIPYGYQANGQRVISWPFSPHGLQNLTPFAHAVDAASDNVNNFWMGKVTQPKAAPNNDLLLVWSSGPVNALNRPVKVPYPDMGIYLLVNETPAYTPTDLVLIKNDPRYNEQQPQPVVPYAAIYGKPQPDALPWVPNDGTQHPALPAGTPFGLVGTSSFYKRNTAPGVPTSNWTLQGSDAGTYTSADIHSVRIVGMEPQSHISYINGGSVPKRWSQAGTVNERLHVMGEIPLRKYTPAAQPVLDVDGNPDTSFLAKIPADYVFTFQTLEANGSALNTSQTWHQVRPGEVRTNCGGCHAHAQVGTDFATTAAGQPGFLPVDLTQQVPAQVEYADVQAILATTCLACAGLTGQQVADQFTKAFQSRISPLITEKTPTATPEQSRLLRTWIDLGACVSLQPRAHIQDTSPCRERNTRPTLHLQVVQTAPASCPAGCAPNTPGSAVLSIGAFAYGGVALTSISSDTQAGIDLIAQATATAHPGIWHVPLPGTGQAVFTVRVTDGVGIWTEKRLAAQW